MIALGSGNSLHLATWTPSTRCRRRILPPIGCSWDCPFSARRAGSSPWTPAPWRPRTAGSRGSIPPPHSPGRPPLASRAARILAARTTPQLRGPWRPRSRKRGANDEDLRSAEAATALRRGSKSFVPATLLPSHPFERHRGEHRLEAATLRLSLAIWEP